MQLLSLDESKHRMLLILKEFDSFCRIHQLRYSLSEGTLLGAVRHKGFIPWDDDIDIVMPRSDYESFIKLWNDTYLYELIMAGKSRLWPFPFIRIADKETVVCQNESDSSFYTGGLWIDVFPIDNCPDDSELFRQFSRRISIYNKLYRIKTRDKWIRELSIYRNLLWLIAKFMLLPIPGEILRNKRDAEMRKYNCFNTSRAGFWAPISGRFRYFPSFFNDYSLLLFEDAYYRVISSYHEYLTLLYGDYLLLPPIEDRVPKHKYQAFLISNNDEE